MFTWEAVSLFLKSPMAKYLGIALIIAGLLYSVYSAGENKVQAKWDADKAKVAAEIKKLKEASVVETVKVETKYVDRVKTVTVKGDTITQYVDRYITPEEDKGCTIPKNFILLHDSAVKNVVPAEANTK
jgi:hypothetical protein